MTNKRDFLICRTEKSSSSMASSMGYSKCSYNKSKCISLSLSSLFSPSLPHPHPHLSLPLPLWPQIPALFVYCLQSVEGSFMWLISSQLQVQKKRKNFSLLSSYNKCPKIDETGLVTFLFLEQSLGPKELLFQLTGPGHILSCEVRDPVHLPEPSGLRRREGWFAKIQITIPENRVNKSWAGKTHKCLLQDPRLNRHCPRSKNSQPCGRN